MLEHGAEEDKSRALSLLLASLHVFGSDPQAIKSIEKALKCGGLEVLQKFVDRLCEPGYRYNSNLRHDGPLLMRTVVNAVP